MSKIKIQVLDPTGIPIHEIETKYSSDQLDRFLSQNRIVIFSDEEPFYFVSEKHRWNPLSQNKDKDETR
jgi:uridylate kinase